MITQPLYGNPLAGGGGFETSFNLLQRPDENIERQYFYNKDLNKLFNMPGGVRMAAPKGFESVTKDQYQDFANKGATLQGASMFMDSMGGGYNLDIPRDKFGNPDRTSPEYNYFYGDSQQKPNIGAGLLGATMPNQKEGMPEAFGSNIPLDPQADLPEILGEPLRPMFMGNATLSNLPPSLEELNPITGGAKNPMDEYQRGYMDSDFYERRTTTNVVPFTYKGKEMTGSGSYASNFKKYLDSIGQGDLIQFPDQSESLATVGSFLAPDNNAFPASPGFTPLPTIPKAIASPGLPPREAPSPDTIVSPLQPMSPFVTNPYQEQFTGFQNQLTGFGDQFTSLNDRLTKIEEGISSLLGNRGQGINLGYNPMMNFGMGIGSLFQPLRGFYGK